MTTTAGHRISEVSAATGFSASALRYYEGVGLIEPDRSPSGYRIYDNRVIERLHFMARAKDLGLTLDEISELLPIWEDYQCADVAQRLAVSVTDRITATRQRIAELTAFASDLERTAHTLTHDVTDGPCGDTCSCTPGAADLDTRLAVVLGPKPQPDSRHDPAPIVCTLSASGAAERVDQWAQLIATQKATPHRRTDDRTASVTVRFPPDPTLAARAAELAAAEQACCAFIAFDLSIDRSGIALTATASLEAADIIDALLGVPT